MIIVRLMGGLGNQLFQYAAARRLASWHDTILKIDTSWLNASQQRSYCLGAFSVPEAFASLDETARLIGAGSVAFRMYLRRLTQRCRPYFRRHIFSESHVGPYDPNILRTPRDVYLNGYWQSEKYFADIEERLREELLIKDEPGAPNRMMLERICNNDSVSIHIRRGDYVSDPAIQRVHGSLTIQYYQRCVDIVAQRVASPHFFVFSDDHDWARENLRISYPTTYVSHNDPSRPHEDLRLMSACKHNVVANSSFSWWAAWLNSNPHKIVLAPRHWFQEPRYDTRDLVPSAWLRV